MVEEEDMTITFTELMQTWTPADQEQWLRDTIENRHAPNLQRLLAPHKRWTLEGLQSKARILGIRENVLPAVLEQLGARAWTCPHCRHTYVCSTPAAMSQCVQAHKDCL